MSLEYSSSTNGRAVAQRFRAKRRLRRIECYYRFSSQLPDDERYNLTAQLRRAATSVPLNIAEGAGCATNVEFAQFLGYAYRSLKEVVTSLELCERLYPAAQPHIVLIDEGHQISRMLHALIKRLRTHNS